MLQSERTEDEKTTKPWAKIRCYLQSYCLKEAIKGIERGVRWCLFSAARGGRHESLESVIHPYPVLNLLLEPPCISAFPITHAYTSSHTHNILSPPLTPTHIHRCTHTHTHSHPLISTVPSHIHLHQLIVAHVDAHSLTHTNTHSYTHTHIHLLRILSRRQTLHPTGASVSSPETWRM